MSARPDEAPSARAALRVPSEQKIVQEQIKYWAIDAVNGLNDAGKQAQEKILSIPQRLERIADAMEARSRAKSFAFDVAFSREFTME